jgi:hypothetical protein
MVEQFDIVKLYKAFHRLPDEARNSPLDKAFLLAIHVINHFLGPEWLEAHVGPSSPENKFFRWNPQDDAGLEIRTFRLVDLGESIFNLQATDGFDNWLEQIRRAESAEASYAELHIARMLHINGWKFRFVARKGKRGNDYDFEIEYNGLTVCADAKCKVESTRMSKTTIQNTLHKSRDQLPSDGPGIFFVKIPQTWMTETGFERVSIEGALAFFSKGTGRIVSVVFYVEPLTWADGEMIQGHFFKEVVNPNRRYGKELDWELFSRWRRPVVGWNALPSSWIRFPDFP